MKLIFFLFLTQLASADHPPKWDSVAVFHRPDKVLIQINESGANGRLQIWMNALNAGEQILLDSRDHSFHMDCARNATAVNCALRLLPSETVAIVPRAVSARVALADLGLGAATAFEPFGFLNSNGDHLEMKIVDGVFELTAGKRR